MIYTDFVDLYDDSKNHENPVRGMPVAEGDLVRAFDSDEHGDVTSTWLMLRPRADHRPGTYIETHSVQILVAFSEDFEFTRLVVTDVNGAVHVGWVANAFYAFEVMS